MWRGIQFGFRVGFNYSQALKQKSRNLLSTSDHPAVVDAYIDKELSLGRLMCIDNPSTSGCISTSTNLAYGQVEGMKTVEYELCDMPSGAAMATQEPAYETVST